MKLKKKINAKLNLTLDILGVENSFHTLKSLVCEINLGDTIKVKKRKDKNISVKVKGHPELNGEKNNAFISARAFMEEFNTQGVDIVIDKKIPIGGGLGGSSADIAGVLLLMKELFDIDKGVEELASRLGSDVNYMMKGGYAVIEGKGQIVNSFDCEKRLYFILLPSLSEVSAKACYEKHDSLNVKSPDCTDKAKEYLIKGDIETLKKVMKNDLYTPARNLLPDIDNNMAILGENAFMTGSGATVYSVYGDQKERDREYKRLKKIIPVIKAQSVMR
ncbi:MAG: 4-(cytidine 5'-diphospho)-2-C-methyl-D-erythritol kinase [Clostridia bacterium]|nr:4-(cytidine 5'-diphospho)-2-C-methyl-D-erythritol kinase [Clostridia bacterium]